MSNNLLKILDKEQIETLSKDKVIPEFKSGDTVRVKVEFSDGVTTRLQNYEGVVLERRNKGVASSFTVRKVVGKSATERVFPLYSPTVASIEVVKYGKVRRAKLYYLRNAFGKAIRIKEDVKRKSQARAKKKDA